MSVAGAAASARRISIVLLAAALLLKIVVLACPVFYHLPRAYHSDSILFKQAGFEYLRTGKFAIPLAPAFMPFVDEICAFYPAIFIYLNTAACAVFYGSDPLIVTGLVDVGVHALLTGLAAGLIIYVSGSSISAAIFLVLSTFFFWNTGRPDDLGALFALGALAVRILWSAPKLRHDTAVLVLLALAAAASPAQGMVGWGAVAVYELLSGRRISSWILLQLVRGVFIPPFVILISSPAFDYRFADAWAQFDGNLRCRYKRLSFDEHFIHHPFWIKFALMQFFLAVGLQYPAYRMAAQDDAAWACFRRLSGGALASIVVAEFLKQPPYGFRFCEVLVAALIAMGLVLTMRLPAERTTVRRLGFAAAWCWYAASFEPLFRFVVLNFIAPLFWNEHYLSFAECRERIQAILPAGAVAAADHTVYWALPQNPPPQSVEWTYRWDASVILSPQSEDLVSGRARGPEYLFCGRSLEGENPVLQWPAWRIVLERDYDEIPIGMYQARGRNWFGPENFGDWNFRVWRRKSVVPPRATVEPATTTP